MAVLFFIVLVSSLVSIPLSSNKSKASILNTVEEEAGGANPQNDEHKSGKSLQCHLPNSEGVIMQRRQQKVTYVIPYSVIILSSNHCQKVIQPPDLTS